MRPSRWALPENGIRLASRHGPESSDRITLIGDSELIVVV
jgi:hypothetical protein